MLLRVEEVLPSEAELEQIHLFKNKNGSNLTLELYYSVRGQNWVAVIPVDPDKLGYGEGIVDIEEVVFEEYW